MKKSKRKRVLYILNKKLSTFKSNRQHTNWVKDCRRHFRIRYWGKRISADTTLSSLKNAIDAFKPDYIYMTIRKRYEEWLPDLTSIKNVPKIFVEMDTCYYSRKDPWYKQFDKLYCRCPWWNGWDKVPFFKWSVPEKAFSTEKVERKGTFFIGEWQKNKYQYRRDLHEAYGDKIEFHRQEGRLYWEMLHGASALVCPTNHDFGNYIPSKLFEYLASGAAVITNCNMSKAGLKSLKSCVIKYQGLEDLKNKLDIDFTKYHDQAIAVMRQNTHVKRYGSLFK